MTFLTARIPLLVVAAATSAGLFVTTGAAVRQGAASPSHTYVIAHRGASAYAPEHTAAAYRLAISQGADYVEQDLGVTRDGILVCTHDTMLERTSNIREVFPDRFTEVKTGDRVARHWFVENFTLAELKQLDAGAWFDPKFAGERMLTFQEAIDIIKGKAGFFPEIKMPSRFRAKGFDPEALVADALRKNGLVGATFRGRPAVHLQVFEEDSLRRLATVLPDVPRSFLIGTPDLTKRWLNPAGLTEMKAFATGIAPAYQIIERMPDLVAQAHQAGLTVVPYTFALRPKTDPYPDAPAEWRKVIDESLRTLPTTPEALTTQMKRFVDVHKVDGLFTDNPDLFPR
ncbi:MAG TPA: glycerophosphodiester phosphodiesterase family protein [Luteitalea sp.]|nr:glycerophosphodiester phosphodiesterase family protein [Luteitalea sp.]